MIDETWSKLITDTITNGLNQSDDYEPTILEQMVKRVFSIRPFESKTNPKWLFVDDNFCYTTKPRTYKEFMDVVKAKQM